MPDKYACYRDLARAEQENRDYRIVRKKRPSEVLVIAPHGGEIEPVTGLIAENIAGRIHSLYVFEGVKPSGNGDLHLTSTRFDEPSALKMAARASAVISVHGKKEIGAAFAMIGGLDGLLARKIATDLKAGGFCLKKPENGISAIHPLNICNRNKTGKGVQLEISYGLRKQLFMDPDSMFRFVSAVQSAVGLSRM